MNTRLVRNIAWAVAGQGLQLLASVTLLRAAYRGLGGDTVGLLYFSLMVAGITGALADVGLASTVSRTVSGAGPEDQRHAQDVVRTAATVCLVVLGVLLLTMAAAGPTLAAAWWGDEPGAAAGREIRWLGCGALLVLPRSLYLGLLRGQHQVHLASMVEAAAALLQQGVAVLLLWAGAGRDAILLWWAASFGVGTVMAFAVAARSGSLRALLPGWNARAVRATAGYAGSMTGIAVLTLAYTHLDKVVVASLLPVAVFGYYGFAFTAVTRTALPAAAIGQAAFPSFCEGIAGGLWEEVAGRYRKLQGLVCLGTIPLATAVAFLSPLLLSIVFDGAVARLLWPTVSILALAYYMGATLQVPHALATALGRTDIALRFNLYALVLLAPVLWVLVARLGPAGAAITWVLYQLLAYGYGGPRIARDCLGTTFRRWLAPVAKAAAIGLPIYGAAFAIGRSLGTPWALPACWVAGTLAFAAAAWRVSGGELRRALTEGSRFLAGVAPGAP